LDKNVKPFEDTIGIIKNLDLVITADTSIAHLSATLEKNTWIVLPFICDWRWFKSDKKTIWYKKANLYRQKKNQNWKDPFKNICRDIKILTKI
jgi:ADP-heptose:LPS heptosyltransferase